ncbi:MAG: nucleoside-diphosphate kinase [archaeon]|nr:nucleoside-diphosphate kinase [archaeon]
MLERTLILIKHDGIQRSLVGEILKRFEQRGMKIIGMKMVLPTKEMALNHYVMTDAWIEKLGNNTRSAAKSKGIELKETNREIAERVRQWNIDYLTEGPIIALAFEGFHAIEIGRKLVGHAEARQAQIGTIRGDFTVESYEMADSKQRTIRSIVHASGNLEEATNELSLWFSAKELHEYERLDWKIMHKH